MRSLRKVSGGEVRRTLRSPIKVMREVIREEEEKRILNGKLKIISRQAERAIHEASEIRKQAERQERVKKAREDARLQEILLKDAAVARVKELKEKQRQWKRDFKARLRIAKPAPKEKVQGWAAIRDKTKFSKFANVAQRVYEDNRMPKLINEHVKECGEEKLRKVSKTFAKEAETLSIHNLASAKSELRKIQQKVNEEQNRAEKLREQKKNLEMRAGNPIMSRRAPPGFLLTKAVDGRPRTAGETLLRSTTGVGLARTTAF